MHPIATGNVIPSSLVPEPPVVPPPPFPRPDPLTRAAAPRSLVEWRRGWPLVGAAMVGAGLGPGLFQNMSSLFTPALQAAFGWSRGDIATAAGLGLIGALVAPLVGRLADRFGVRPIILGSMLVLAAGYLCLATLGGGLWQYHLGVLLIVMALPGTSSLSYGKLIAVAFRRQRGLALALGTSGLALMTMVAAPVLGAVVAHWGWRAGFVLLAVAGTVLALPPILLGIRGIPAAGAPPVVADAPLLPGVSAKEARRDRRFWLMVASALLVNLATTGLVTQLVPIGVDRGLGAGEAALLLTGFGVSAIAGRLLVGTLIDRFRPQPVAATVALISAAAFALLAGGAHGLAPLMALVFLAGLMNGAENDLLPFLAARLFGLRAYAEIYGSAMPVALLGTALGIIGFGRLHDLFGNYAVALAIGSAALLAAATCFLLLPDRAEPSPN